MDNAYMEKTTKMPKRKINNQNNINNNDIPYNSINIINNIIIKNFKIIFFIFFFLKNHKFRHCYF